MSATPIIITHVDTSVCIERSSPNIAHPSRTATTGTIYAKEFAMIADSTLSSYRNSVYPTTVHNNIRYKNAILLACLRTNKSKRC